MAPAPPTVRPSRRGHAVVAVAVISIWACAAPPNPTVVGDSEPTVTDAGADAVGPQPESQSQVDADGRPSTPEDTQSPGDEDGAEKQQETSGPPNPDVTPPPDDGPAPPPECGDGACAPDESGATCPEDCGATCGDGVCNGDEDTTTCVPDCGWTGTCPEVPTPTPAEEAPMAGGASGSWETTTVDGFTDDYLYNADGSFKVGIRREWGGTVIFFGMAGDGPGVNGTNVIDSHDTGREVQVAFYDEDRVMQGCAHNATCASDPGGACQGGITFLGWNPVQGGNECNNGSGVDWVTGDDGVLAMKTQPLFWNPDWQQAGCGNDGCGSPALNTMKSDVTYTQRLRFVNANVVELDMVVTNLGADSHYYPIQEFPTVYGSFGHAGTPNLSAILSSDGQPVTPDGQDGNGFNYGDYDSPGGWSALQNTDHTYGVGLYHENHLTPFRAYWKEGVFNNFRARFPFTLPGNGTVRARAYLMLGGFDTLSNLAAGLTQDLAPFGALESPPSDANLNGVKAEVTGWVLDNQDVTLLEVLVDGEEATTLAVDQGRPDVCSLYPAYEMCDTVGFAGVLDLAALSPCAHLLEIRATDTHGNQRIIARQRFFLSGDGNPGGGEPPPEAACGDGACDPLESFETCPADCPQDSTAAATVDVRRFRFVDGTDEDHMFSVSDTGPEGYVKEGIAFRLFSESGPGLQALYQSYCAPCTDHLQTTSQGEGAPSYTDEEVLGYCSSAPTEAAPKALRRLFSPDKSDHFVTADEAEVPGAEDVGYLVEGDICWVPDD